MSCPGSVPASAIRLRSSQWLTFIGANLISKVRHFIPWMGKWSWYIGRRCLLIYAAKHAIDCIWLCFKRRKLGVTFFRELTLMHWVPPSMHFDKDTKMKVFLRKCGYQDTSDVGDAFAGREVEPWFYGEAEDVDNNKVLEKKAMKQAFFRRTTQSEEMRAVIRTLSNFKEFNAEEIMEFFKASEPVEMAQGDIIFSADNVEEYYYSVVSGEIHLFAEKFGPHTDVLIKVAAFDECLVSVRSFLHHLAIGPQKYDETGIYAVCGESGKYYRTPISKLIEYANSDKSRMKEMIENALARLKGISIGLNDLTGILPRLRQQSCLVPYYETFHTELGVYTGTWVARKAFVELDKIIKLSNTDRAFCWVGVLDSKTILQRRYRKTRFAFFIYKGLVACTTTKPRRAYNAIQYYVREGYVICWREAALELNAGVQFEVADNAKAFLIAIPDFLLRRYLRERPDITLKLALNTMARDSQLMLQIAYAIRFSHCRPGEAIYGRGDKSLQDPTRPELETYAYLCISGRLRFLIERTVFGSKQASAIPQRYGITEKGDWFGMASVYTDNPSFHRTVICDRYCVYSLTPRYLLLAITNAFPEAAGYQCDFMARAIDRDLTHRNLDTDKIADTQYQVDSFGVHTSRTYRFVCVYAASPDIPGKIYCEELARHHTCQAVVITKADALEALNVDSIDVENDYLLAQWLVAREEEATLLFVLATNETDDHWNETVAMLCDLLHVLVTYSVSHKETEGESFIIDAAKKARKELVFMHPVVQMTKPQIGPTKFPHLPQGSVLWLRPRRSWVQAHHHVRILDSAMKYAKEKNPRDLERYWHAAFHPDKHSDFARVMRWITGQSVGIVLGGGGAKGAAHLGTLHYLRELDVPFDYIAGVSIGSFLGALYCLYENMEVVEAKAKELWENLKHPGRFARDITVNPFSSLFRGHSFSWMINYFFGDIQIEDLYIPFFCVSTDLNDNCSRTHMSGDLWFYVRASMTLTGLFPPQINHFDYHLLVDGGYSDLVPAMTMRKLGIKYMVAINIGDETHMNAFNIGYHVSGWKCLLQSLMPHSIYPMPSHFDIWDAILFCSAKNFIQIIKAMDEYCIYVRPNINAYSGTDFQFYDEIKRLGYLSTKFKFGGLHMKNLPVHVIWYLLRFYTYPAIAQSQAQILSGFTNEDWQFAVDLMSKTQMHQRAVTTFLKMNLTPYLTDLMEARPYLEGYLNGNEDISRINLNVPVLENFFRGEEKLDLVHAIARMRDPKYMEPFESIIARQAVSKEDLTVGTKLHTTFSDDTQDLMNATIQMQIAPTSVDPFFGVSGESGLKEMFLADPSLFQAVASYRHLKNKHKRERETTNLKRNRRKQKTAREPIRARQKIKDSFTRLSVMGALFDTISATIFNSSSSGRVKPRKSVLIMDQPTRGMGQSLMDYRKHLTLADQKRNKMVNIMTLKEFKKSLGEPGGRGSFSIY